MIAQQLVFVIISRQILPRSPTRHPQLADELVLKQTADESLAAAVASLEDARARHAQEVEKLRVTCLDVKVRFALAWLLFPLSILETPHLSSLFKMLMNVQAVDADIMENFQLSQARSCCAARWRLKLARIMNSIQKKLHVSLASCTLTRDVQSVIGELERRLWQVRAAAKSIATQIPNPKL